MYPGLLCLRSEAHTLKTNFDFDLVILLRSKHVKVCALAATCNATNATTLSVNFFRDRPFKGESDLKRFRRMDTSHVSEYLGTGGRRLNTAFTNLITHG